jgi:hypothetical protein
MHHLLFAIGFHSHGSRQIRADFHDLVAPVAYAFRMVHPLLAPGILGACTDEARNRASGVFPFADDLLDERGRMIVIEGIPSRQRCMIRFRRPALAVFACAENPGRPAKIWAQQTPEAFGNAIKLRPDEFVNLGG